VDVGVIERTGAELGRRERKKLETRRALFRAAIELFSERGVDATTVEDIAEAVDVSARTFHRYFASKEDVLFFDAAERRARFAAYLDGRPAGEALLDSLRAAAHDLTDAFLGDPADDGRRLALIRSSVTLRAQNLHHTDLLSQVVAEFAAARLSIDAHDPLPRLLGACTIAALRTAREGILGPAPADPHTEIDRCFDLVADLRAATTPSPARPPARRTTP
jgi:AcrR family transcriptional regulator